MPVERWTGGHAVAMQRAMRLTNEKFAELLGMSPRSVANWHQDPDRVLATLTQQVLDAALRRSDVETQTRFAALLAHETGTGDPHAAYSDMSDRTKQVLLAALQGGVASLPNDLSGVLAAVAELHEGVEDLLADGTGRRTRLARLEEEVDHHGRDALVVPPMEMICRIGLDLADARHLGRTARTDAERTGVKRIVARMAAVTADELSVLGNVPAARSWYSTAIAAADATDDISLRADIRALAAMLPLYHGNPDDVVSMAGTAQALAGNHSCFAASLAPMLAGLAWARIGNHSEARASMEGGRRAHDLIASSAQAESVFGFSLRRRLFYESRLLTLIGDHKNARTIQTRALELYPAYVVGDPALMSLDEAMGLVAAREYEAGARLAASTVDGLPPAQRGQMFISSAQTVLHAIPRAHRKLPGVEDSLEAIAELASSSAIGPSSTPDSSL
jgi:hypothetical protein